MDRIRLIVTPNAGILSNGRLKTIPHIPVNQVTVQNEE